MSYDPELLGEVIRLRDVVPVLQDNARCERSFPIPRSMQAGLVVSDYLALVACLAHNVCSALVNGETPDPRDVDNLNYLASEAVKLPLPQRDEDDRF